MSDGTAITSTFTVIVDGQTFGPFPAGSSRSEISFLGQILGYEVDTSTGGNTGAVEVEAFAG